MRERWSSSEVDDKAHLILVAPAPVFARLERAHDWVTHSTGVLGCVSVRGGVAAADLPAAQADPQVDPVVAGLEAFLAAVDLSDRRRLHRNLIQMRAGDYIGHLGSSRGSMRRRQV